jgi:hypothetical protein
LSTKKGSYYTVRRGQSDCKSRAIEEHQKWQIYQYQAGERELGSVTVKHNPHSIAKLLLLHEAKQCHQVAYDSWDQDGVFQVHTVDGIVEFIPSSRWLHYHDESDPSSNVELMLVNTVR